MTVQRKERQTYRRGTRGPWADPAGVGGHQITAARGTLGLIKDTENMGHFWVRSRVGQGRVMARIVGKGGIRVRVRVRGLGLGLGVRVGVKIRSYA